MAGSTNKGSGNSNPVAAAAATEPQNRDSRDVETREAGERPKRWKRAALLPEPNPVNGIQFRWVRLSTLSRNDVQNMHSRMREGWVPVKKEEVPEIELLLDESAKFKDNIVVGGLILCKAPTEMVSQRTEHFAGVTSQQMETVDNNFLAQNDARMPVFNERRSSISFGEGR